MRQSVFSSIEAKLNELIDIEMKMRASRKAQAQGWMFTFDPEDRDQAKVLQESIDGDEPYLFVPLGQSEKVKALQSGAPYITDKQEQDRQKVENDIMTMLGVNNIGVGEKKEHLVVAEVNANNEDVQEQDNAFESQISSDFERINKCFGKSIQVIDMNEMYMGEDAEEEDEDIEPKEDTDNDESK